MIAERQLRLKDDGSSDQNLSPRRNPEFLDCHFSCVGNCMRVTLTPSNSAERRFCIFAEVVVIILVMTASMAFQAGWQPFSDRFYIPSEIFFLGFFCGQMLLFWVWSSLMYQNWFITKAYAGFPPALVTRERNLRASPEQKALAAMMIASGCCWSIFLPGPVGIIGVIALAICALLLFFADRIDTGPGTVAALVVLPQGGLVSFYSLSPLLLGYCLTKAEHEMGAAAVLLIWTCFFGMVGIGVFVIARGLRTGITTLTEIRSKPDLLLPRSTKDRDGTKLLVIVLWSLLVVSQLLGVTVALSVLQRALVGIKILDPFAVGQSFLNGMGASVPSDFVPFSRTSLPSRAFVILYELPVVLWLRLLIGSNVSRIQQYIELRKQCSIPPPAGSERAFETVVEISKFGEVRPPLLLIESGMRIDASVLVSPLPWGRDIIITSERAAKELPLEELEALLAHEIGHIKQKHTLAWRVLSFLSRWTLVGEGFLFVLTSDAITLETEADRFAVSWLERLREGPGRHGLIRLLDRIERQTIQSQMSVLLGRSVMAVSFGEDECFPSKQHNNWFNSAQGTTLQKLSGYWQAARFFYFEGWRAAYVHYPYSKRVQSILDFVDAQTKTIIA